MPDASMTPEKDPSEVKYRYRLAQAEDVKGKTSKDRNRKSKSATGKRNSRDVPNPTTRRVKSGSSVGSERHRKLGDKLQKDKLKLLHLDLHSDGNQSRKTSQSNLKDAYVSRTSIAMNVADGKSPYHKRLKKEQVDESTKKGFYSQIGTSSNPQPNIAQWIKTSSSMRPTDGPYKRVSSPDISPSPRPPGMPEVHGRYIQTPIPTNERPLRASVCNSDSADVGDSLPFESFASGRAVSSTSNYSTKSSLTISFNTITPVSAWSDYRVPDGEELRRKLLKGKFGKDFENYYPSVYRQKLLRQRLPSDDEDYDTDLEEEGGLDLTATERARQRRQDSPFPEYKQMCRSLKIVPNNYFLRHALDDDFTMKYRYPPVNDTKALSKEIQTDATISRLDLSDNGLESMHVHSIAKMLHNNTTISEINLSENKLGREGARLISIVLMSESRLVSLNLSGNRLGNKGVKAIIDGLQTNVFLKELNLSHNEIGEHGIMYLSPFLASNVTLDLIDLSWNHIRKHSSVSLGRAIQQNQQLRVFRMSMNGLHVDGARAFGEALEDNTTLIELDIRACRIPRAGARALAEGLSCNRELTCLKIGFNPLSAAGTDAIISAVEERDNSEGIEVDLEGIYISQELESRVIELMDDRRVNIIYTLEPSRRGRTRDLISTYIQELVVLMKAMNIDVNSIFSEVDDNLLISAEDIVRRVMKFNAIRTNRMYQARLNHFIYSNGNRRFFVRDWVLSVQYHGYQYNLYKSPMTTSGSSDSRRPHSSVSWKESATDSTPRQNSASFKSDTPRY